MGAGVIVTQSSADLRERAAHPARALSSRMSDPIFWLPLPRASNGAPTPAALSAPVSTSWADLANLGWSKQQAYDRFHARRGGTMEGLGDMAMNEGFAKDWGCYAYNDLIGHPRIVGKTTDNIESSKIVFMYDNTASLIPNVGGSKFSIEISTDSTKEVTKENVHSLSKTWDITVMPGEFCTLQRVRTVSTGQMTYDQDYGMGTTVSWPGFPINRNLNYPQGTMSLSGRLTQESYTFRPTPRRVPNDGSWDREEVIQNLGRMEGFVAHDLSESYGVSISSTVVFNMRESHAIRLDVYLCTMAIYHRLDSINLIR
ncbi:hypothetical protein B0H17DRAFT_1331428 [Mycena rosella]|uniref:Uncharacterized protein n=1 Tax=Mycena rosella TaxID=1033263 RepID=A0AAD7GJ33_MYCRO|nr:hypothetical protein B0H17DRAFT_1331428 [Mycena rosella]